VRIDVSAIIPAPTALSALSAAAATEDHSYEPYDNGDRKHDQEKKLQGKDRKQTDHDEQQDGNAQNGHREERS
jgi:hypothetical protein